IPRFDTENLVHEVIGISKSMDSPQILELGSGSGAIACTLAMEVKKSDVIGADISDDALKVCNINKERYKINNLNFIKSDLFKNVEGIYDIIFSNPPYIKSDEMSVLQREVKWEPELALDGGVDGLDFYKKIIKESPNHLKYGGYLFFEIGYDQGLSVKQLLLDGGFNKIEIIKDLQGFDRVIKAVMED
ncbi:MAG: peptide chain release factor N(5)-glutamine methyltransferase, partial [Gallicola sp.]|nr:peptide chain release factor N(5)-glutamine methyltransferase [Gallicola sp.]